MQDEPGDLTKELVVEALRLHRRIETRDIEYAPVGFGSYHWRVLDNAGRRWFVTADRPSNMPGFGLDATGNEAALLAAYETALALRDAGLEFVVAPVATSEGKLIRHPAPDWCLALFPHIEGASYGAGTWAAVEDQVPAASLVGRLHGLLPQAVTQRWTGAIPDRSYLEDAVSCLDVPWSTGPYAEPTRHALRDARVILDAQISRYDRLLRDVLAMPEPWVTTHGEPHHANFIKSPDGGLHLIDWGTVRLAPRERDLWLVLQGNDAALSAYEATAGDYAPRPEPMALFNLLWQLTDLSIYVRRFREPHGDGADDAKSFRGIEATLGRIAALPSP